MIYAPAMRLVNAKSTPLKKNKFSVTKQTSLEFVDDDFYNANTLESVGNFDEKEENDV